MKGRAENKVPLKFYIDEDLKEEFKKYAIKYNSNMSEVMTKYIQNYVKKAKRDELKINK